VESHMLAANDVFWASSLLFLAMTVVVWWARPGKTGSSASAAGGAH